MIEIDGSQGEGGGQILRSSLSLSLLTGVPFRLYNIRAGRSQPGLRRQHLAAVQAAAQIGQAAIAGDKLNSRDLLFEPGAPVPGEYTFRIDSAGSAMLVLQTVLPVLLHADKPSNLTLEGGTHNPWAPPYDFLEQTFAPLLERMGAHVRLKLERPGFYPTGAGKVLAHIQPAETWRPLELTRPLSDPQLEACAIVSQLPRHIAERELKTLAERLPIDSAHLKVIEETRAAGPGNVVLVFVRSDQLTEVFAGFGRKGLPAERVAEMVARETEDYLNHGAPVGPHLADQLLLPLALGAGGRFLTSPPTQHTRTNIEVLGRFLTSPITMTETPDGNVLIEVAPNLQKSPAN